MGRTLYLAVFLRFRIEEVEAPALVIRYGKKRPPDSGHRFQYWSPKTDWAVTQAEVLSNFPQNRSTISVREVLEAGSRSRGP